MKHKLLIAEIVILLFLAFVIECTDDYFSGDEVVTYSMANNDKAGFVFSDGRVSNYLEDEVFTSDSSIIIKLGEVASDLIKRREAASILTYPRDPEVKLYSKQDVDDWFSKRNDERFNVFSTWLHSVSDDGNSWLYYSLVNVSSSIFMELSPTKWAGFIINILFHAFTLILLFKLGQRVGNSYYQNLAMLIFLGCSFDILTTTVTNLRAYTVASFFTTLLVLMILNIHDSIISENAIHFKDALLVVLIYMIGYVSHYTIGAVLVSFGVVLLFYMILDHSKGLAGLVIVGFIAVVCGFCISPDSIVGILKKFMVSGAGAAITGKGSSFSIGMISLTIVSFVLLGLIVVAVLKNKEYTKNKLVFMTNAALFMLFIILLGTKGYGYTRVLFPVMYLVIFRWMCLLEELLSEKCGKRIVKIATVMILAGYVMVNLIVAKEVKASENHEFLAKEAALDGIDLDTCVYFRKHAQGYADTRCLLDRFEKVQVITLDTDGWKDMVEYKPQGEPFVCFFSDDCMDESVLKWIESLGYDNNQELYVDDATNIFVAISN